VWGTRDPFGPDDHLSLGAAIPLAHIEAQVPDAVEQAARRAAFQRTHPDVHLARVGDRAQATVPAENDGSRTITRPLWREVLDELGAPGAADSGPG
jgi:hypothetical protein